MRGNVGHIETFWLLPGQGGDKSAAYNYTFNSFKFYQNHPSGYGTFHEMIHVLDDANGWYPGGREKSERLAYAGEGMVRSMTLLKAFQTGGLEDANASHLEMNDRWHRAWDSIRTSVTLQAEWNVGFFGTGKADVTFADVSDVGKKLGFKLSASKLTTSANNWLERHGRPPCLTVPSGLPTELQ